MEREIQRVAEKRIDESEVETDPVEFIVDVRVTPPTVEYSPLAEDEWKCLGSIREFATRSLATLLDGLVPSPGAEVTLQEISAAAKRSWDEDAEMFCVEQIRDSGGLRSLVVPLQTSVSEDVDVMEIYDADGNFVAHDVEDQLDCELYELEGEELYVDSLSDTKTVYAQRGTKGFFQLFSEQIQEEFKNDDWCNQEDFGEWLFATMFGTVVLGGILSLTLSVGAPGVVIVVFGSPLLILPAVMWYDQINAGAASARNGVVNYGENDYTALFELRD